MVKPLIVFVTVLVFIIILQNTQVVNLRFLFWNVSMSQIVLLPLIFAAGVTTGYFLGKK